MTSVLFVCVKNGGKSQMAAGLFRALADQDPEPARWQVASAGTKAGTTLNALSVASLADVGVDIGDQRPRQLTPALQQAADLVVTVGEAEVQPLDGPRYEVWEIDEPSLRGIDGPERMALVRDDIARHVDDLHRRLVAADEDPHR
ncbi:arsenate-mycothiol transferase ArsC [Microlunatus flavus]|uniref:Arsenate-mycothiol transferase n=1 Tax=Microlunatus flavus TaxID=1036181 RepID=A0A1H9L4Q1_9ACTN|nr:low molecular weight phosphatase family protein [Microlunatus flavus]SER06376.1 arsenate-mycothiol transferase [Microlunatus flavus]